MKPATIEEVKAEQKIFTDLWNVFKKFYHATTDDEWRLRTLLIQIGVKLER